MREGVAHVIELSAVCCVSAASFLAADILIDSGRDPIASRGMDDPLYAANIFVEPVTKDQAQIGRAGYMDFGKGSGHPA